MFIILVHYENKNLLNICNQTIFVTIIFVRVTDYEFFGLWKFLKLQYSTHLSLVLQTGQDALGQSLGACDSECGRQVFPHGGEKLVPFTVRNQSLSLNRQTKKTITTTRNLLLLEKKSTKQSEKHTHTPWPWREATPRGDAPLPKADLTDG